MLCSEFVGQSSFAHLLALHAVEPLDLLGQGVLVAALCEHLLGDPILVFFEFSI